MILAISDILKSITIENLESPVSDQKVLFVEAASTDPKKSVRIKVIKTFNLKNVRYGLQISGRVVSHFKLS